MTVIIIDKNSWSRTLVYYTLPITYYQNILIVLRNITVLKCQQKHITFENIILFKQ